PLSDGLLCQIARKIKNRRMRNRTYGGVRGRKTKVGRKLLRFPPTRLFVLDEHKKEELPKQLFFNHLYANVPL
ncbi:MAG: hypothetical protein U0M54_01595, partial [Bacteroidales bacterium]